MQPQRRPSDARLSNALTGAHGGLDHTRVPNRHFTVDEANEVLPAVRPLVERMVAHRRALAAALARREELTTTIAGNGGGIPPQQAVEVQSHMEQEAAGVARCIDGLEELGVLVKDLDTGLVDFPALRGGEEVVLCWRLGEDEIRYWHGLEEGSAGRKELPL